MTGRALALALIAALLAPAAQAKVARVGLAELAAGANAIVLGRVIAVLDVKRLRVAVVEVKRVLKGARVETISYLAQPTWTCDEADGAVGDEALFFLVTPADDDLRYQPIAGSNDLAPFYLLAHAGRGKMPVSRAGGEARVIVSRDVQLPPGLLAGDDRGPGPHSARLDDLMVQVLGEATGTPH